MLIRQACWSFGPMRRTLDSIFRLSLGIALTMLATTGLGHAGLPDVSQLPANPNLPDPLVMLNGERITTPAEWVAKRRPELKELFQYYMYGYLPAPLKIQAKV